MYKRLFLKCALGVSLVLLLVVSFLGRRPALAQPPCLADAPVRFYHVVAIPIRIVYNKWGDHDPNGMMYVLKQNEARVRALVRANPLTPVSLVQPLVIRANAGECVEILFENKLPFNAGMTPHDLAYDVTTSDGAAVGRNGDTTAPPRGTRRYRWQTPDHEGIHIFSDLGNPIADQTGSNLHGLFGALIVEPRGAWWTDPETGRPLDSGLFADIHLPGAPDFREYATIFHDEPEVLDANGNVPTDPVTGEPSATFPINYRSEPSRNRIRFLEEHPDACPECVGEEVSLSSWPFGDPPDEVIPRAYVGDPAKFRVIMAGVKETHVFHLHAHQWLQEPEDINSTVVDSIQISPQTSFTIVPLFGAGSQPATFGDSIFHCHLYPHFAEGMWGLWRVFDTLQGGRGQYPDGTPIKRLVPLPDRKLPPPPTPQNPGYPNFIPGTVGRKAPHPPLFDVNNPRQPTPQELAASRNPNPRPGAFFVEPCPADAPVREFDIVAIQVELTYNDQGWHDPEGRILVLAEDEADIRAGRKRPEPLFIRANAGECVNVNFTNKLPRTLGGNAFQPVFVTNAAAIHIHLVKFDVLSSDGATNGWNYDQSSQLQDDGSFQTVRYTWFANEELQTVFFHDHMFANLHQNHGYFGALVVEPPGSRFLNPQTGAEIKSGTQAMIVNPNLPDFREFGLAVHDFAFLLDAAGNPINPPPVPGVPADPGVMGVNYRNEPLQFRTGPDTAYAFSSFVHGDPGTPTFRTLTGDPIRLRLIHGAHEESHILNINGARWRARPFLPNSPLVAAQSIGISEAFNAQFTLANGLDGRTRDHLWWFGGMDDLWLGLWGLIRVHTGQPPDLLPLPDRGPLPVAQAADDPARLAAAGGPSPGSLPPPATDPGQSCPADAPVRFYDVVAFQNPIRYNDFGDHDPHGLIFALAGDEDEIRAGRNPEPLVLRANQGECIEVRLTNKLLAPLPPHPHPEVPVEAPFPFSQRVSLHAQLVKYDMLGSDGSAVGFNPDQTIGPGESRLYRWYADEEVGAANLWSFTDIRNQRHHGLWAGLIIEPPGSEYLDPVTGAPVATGTEVVIHRPGLDDFREFVVFGQDGIPLVDASGVPVLDPPEADDPEDQGFKGFNYRSERFGPRLANNPARHLVFSSLVHGDPATPIFRSYVGDPVTVRYLMPADKPRNHGFTIHAHSWIHNGVSPLPGIFVNETALSVGNALDLELIGGAGGLGRLPGDFMYRSGNIQSHIEQGMWGLIRAFAVLQPDLLPLSDQPPPTPPDQPKPDDPRWRRNPFFPGAPPPPVPTPFH